MWILVLIVSLAGGYTLAHLLFSSSSEERDGTKISLGDEPRQDSRIIELIEQGYASKAVKLYAEQHGVGMMEAMQRIDEIEQQLNAEEQQPTESDSASVPTQHNTDSAEWETEILDLLQQGKKIEAIKIFRNCTGLGLKDAKEQVERLGSESNYSHTTQSEYFTSSVSSSSHTTCIEDPVMLELLKQGKKIEAIKRFREQTGAGLKEAKDIVDALAQNI